MKNVVSLIVKKREGQELTDDEIHGLVRGFLRNEVLDYQMSAWLMAALLKGLSDRETATLTDAMLVSGTVLSLPTVEGKKVDKHSTGGVGDKISLCLAPAVAALGVPVPMISGRGLGHTGGTLDKLESIAGYQTRLSLEAFERIVAKVGCSIIGQTKQIAPADRRMYALRDVTGTVESVPLIVASILSKKLAAGLDGLVLDVKVGSGAFMRTVEDARRLGRALASVGKRSGMDVRPILTDMNAPIGRAVGNALEVVEAIEVLRGEGPADTTELTVELGAEMCLIAGAARTRADGRRRMAKVLGDGSALERFSRMVEAHGGDPRIVDDPTLLPRTRHRRVVSSERAGVVTAVDSKRIGLVAVALGAGRTRADQEVDAAVGIEVAVHPGDRVERGAPLAWVHVRRPGDARRVESEVRSAFRLASRAKRGVVRTRIRERL